jgi:hypothetical protein
MLIAPSEPPQLRQVLYCVQVCFENSIGRSLLARYLLEGGWGVSVKRGYNPVDPTALLALPILMLPGRRVP